ncbi:DHA2 family efflux MFS transporter permease subunit [Cohnella sp. CFH 77786]|uniref:DHA2 family efflux MFS transporter permease subunit n=1 Tax=Cohnella sp. CFH 77786 TaxID=2662265 RepID=UPI001C61057A|nr:DHA2 family efflux MFS transporter permease subunit [Cohnella sp. CFH 77786]MBW5446132.1 DHA2 family efflux MFS transporter permease subunit [Cohnella sp. CFH 77786]
MTTQSAVSSAPAEQSFSIKSIIGPVMAVVVGMIMVILDSTVVNVAMPNLIEYFNTSVSTMQWSITAYTLALSAVIPLAGWLTDRYGAKQIFLITIVLFTLGSVLCSLAQTPEQLILYRIIQGLGGGMVSPIGMAIIFRLAPPGKQGSIMGVLGVPMMLAPAIGPTLSGFLVEYASWHWIFLVNLPIGIIALLVGIKYLPKFEQKSVPALDVIGMVLAPITFASLAYAVSEGGKDWGSTQTVTGLIVGGVALILFIMIELRHKQPLLELRVFGSSDFTRGIIISWLSMMALFGSFLLVPMYLQTAKGFSPMESGLMSLPQVIMSGLFMPIGGKLFDRIGARPLAIIGLCLVGSGLFMLSQISVDTGTGYVIMTLILTGAGMGLSMMPINTHILKAAPRRLVSRVTSLTAAAQQVVVSFAVAGLTGYFSSRVTHYMATAKEDQVAAMTSAFADTFLFAAYLALAGAVLALILRKPKVGQGDEQSDKQANAMSLGH